MLATPPPLWLRKPVTVMCVSVTVPPVMSTRLKLLSDPPPVMV